MMNSKMMASGGPAKAKMMASGGMPMVKKDGKSVPAFAADGKGKMAKGGMPKALKEHADKKASVAHKGLKAGGMAKMMSSGGATKMGKVKTGSGIDGIAARGKTRA